MRLHDLINGDFVFKFHCNRIWNWESGGVEERTWEPVNFDPLKDVKVKVTSDLDVEALTIVKNATTANN